MPTGYIGTAAGRVCWIGMFVAFFAGVLVQFIGFGHRIRQATEGGKPTCHHGLDGMSALQQMPTVNTQFVRQMLGWGALRNPTQQEDNRGTAIAGLGEERIGEQIEDRATRPTALVHDRRAMPIMWCLLWW
jgi:hypothetical protein